LDAGSDNSEHKKDEVAAFEESKKTIPELCDIRNGPDGDAKVQ